MLATDDHRTSSLNEWPDCLPINGMVWMNDLTTQTIPEETDGIESDSQSVSSSAESCYIVLEIQRPRLQDDDELHFAQTEIDHDSKCIDESVEDILVETPNVERLVEIEETHSIVKECAIINEIKIEQLSTKTKRYSKRTRLTHRCSDLTTSSDDERTPVVRPKTVRKSNNESNRSTSSISSITSIDSIENKQMPLTKTATAIQCDTDKELPKETSMSSYNRSFSKGSSLISLMKKYARTMSSEYRLSNEDRMRSIDEPTLIQVKYLDGRISLPKTQSIHDVSQTGSYRKRFANRFRTIIEQNFLEPSNFDPSKPWQQKTLAELFYERKQKLQRPS